MTTSNKSFTSENITVLLVCAFMMYAWLDPNHYLPWGMAYSGFSSICALLCMMGYVFYKRYQLIIPKAVIFIPFIALIPIIQLFFFPYLFSGEVFIICVHILSFFTCVVLAYSLASYYNSSKKLFLIFSFLFIFSGMFSLYVGLVQWLNLPLSTFMNGLPVHNRPSANFNQPNFLAFFLIICFYCGLYLFEKRRINRVGLAFLSLFFLFGVALTQSRMGWLSIFCTCLFMLFFISSKKEQFRLSRIFFVMALAVFVFFVYFIPEFANTFLDNSYEVASGVDRATKSHPRISLWNMLLKAVEIQPWFGYGWEQVGYAQITATPYVSHYEYVTYSHNVFLDLIIWNGIPLAVVIVFFISRMLIKQLVLINSIESIFAMVIICAFLVYSMVEFPYAYLFFLLPVGFLLGIILFENSSNGFSINTKYFFLPLAVFILIFGLVLREYIIIQKNVTLMRFEMLNIGTKHSKEKAPNVLFLNQLKNHIGFIRTNPLKKMNKKELTYMHMMASKYPNPVAIKRYAQALAYNGFKEKAQKQLYFLQKIYNIDIKYDELLIKKYSLNYQWEETATGIEGMR